MSKIAIVCSAIIGVSILCSPIVAQAKTAKECRAEWQANKAANQAKKITESAYIKECVAGGAAAQPRCSSSCQVDKDRAKNGSACSCPRQVYQDRAKNGSACRSACSVIVWGHWGQSIHNRGASQGALRFGHRRLGQSELEDISLRGAQRLRHDKIRRIYV